MFLGGEEGMKMYVRHVIIIMSWVIPLQDFTDSAYTSHDHRENILLLCDRVRLQLNQLLRAGLTSQGSALTLVSVLALLLFPPFYVCFQHYYPFSA